MPPNPETDVKEKIIEFRIRNHQREYRTRWVGYTEDDDTWEQQSAFKDCPNVLAAFFREQREQRAAELAQDTNKKNRMDLILKRTRLPAFKNYFERSVYLQPGRVFTIKGITFEVEEVIYADEHASIVKVLGFQNPCVKVLKISANDRKSLTLIRNELQKAGDVFELDVTGSYGVAEFLFEFNHTDQNARRKVQAVSYAPVCSTLHTFFENNYFRPFPMEHIRFIIYQLCRSVHFMHRMRLVHTNINLKNVFLFEDDITEHVTQDLSSRVPNGTYLLRDATILLGGLCASIYENEWHNLRPTKRCNRAPEFFLGLPCDYAVDVWSLGCIMYHLFYGRPPFPATNKVDKLCQIEEMLGPIPTELAEAVNQERREEASEDIEPLQSVMEYDEEGIEHFYDLLSRMLKWEPEHRITMCSVLRHPFFLPLSDDERNVVKHRHLGNNVITDVLNRITLESTAHILLKPADLQLLAEYRNISRTS